jgi:hypothetical protein
MKKYYKLLLNSLLIFVLVVLTNMAHAQTPVGPSATAPVITTSTPPAGVSKVYCAGSTITLTAAPTGYTTYQWYKVNSSGTAVLVLSNDGSTPYTEATTSTAAAAGYYNYQLVVINSNGCSSPASTISVYVVPPLTVSITNLVTSVCSGTTAPTLTATPLASVVAAGYALDYQWTLGGTNIVGANSATYTVPVTTTTTVLPLNYGVTVTYALNPACSASATQTITIDPLPTQPTITAS